MSNVDKAKEINSRLKRMNPTKPRDSSILSRDFNQIFDKISNGKDTEDFWADNPFSTNDLHEFASIYNAVANFVEFKAPKMRMNAKQIEDKLDAFDTNGVVYDKSDAHGFLFVSPDITLRDEVTLKEFNFGQFKIYLKKNGVTIYPHRNNITLDSGHFHPYCSTGGELCLGDFKKQYLELISNNYLFEALDVVMTCLTTYSQQSEPHQTMDAWMGILCASCDEYFEPDRAMVKCQESQKPICGTCADSCTDENSKLYYLPGFLKKCKNCKKRVRHLSSEKLCANCI